MRHLPQDGTENFRATLLGHESLAALAWFVLAAASLWTQGCASGVGAGAGVVTPTPPPTTSINVLPSNISVLLGNTQIFVATVTNTNDTSVSWSVNGVVGGNATLGTITTDGVYTAPADLPLPAAVQVTATSHADSAKGGNASVTVTSDIAVTLTPTASGVELGATQPFQAAVRSAGHPDTAVRWTISGAGCAMGCGSVDTNGDYTAPQILPTPPTVTLAAQSVADAAKQTSSAVTITSNFTLRLSAPSSVPTGGSATISATLTPVPGSQPSTALSWSLSGAGCGGASCGALNVLTPQSGVDAPSTISASYSAPMASPSPSTVTITVTPQADPSKKAQATLTILQGVGVSVSPTAATLAGYHRVTLTAHVSGTQNAGVNWSVNGIANGNGNFGQICVLAISPCQAPTGGSFSQVEYQAPGAIPNPNPVTVQVAGLADPTKSASAQIKVLNHVVVSVQPASVTLAPFGVQGFTANVLGAGNQNVIWQIRGTGCIAAACGIIDANGTYTAPGVAPSPNTLQVVAVSADDTLQSAAANVSISTGASILALHPGSVYAGGADGFTLRVDGSNLVPTSPGPGSILLIGGTAKTTTCSSGMECTAPVNPSDVAIPGTVSVQIRNPDGTFSNAVSLVVAATNSSYETISLTGTAPAAVGKDIVVVEPTTAGVSAPGAGVDLNVAALGAFSVANNSCVLAGNPIVLQRPAGATAAADICVFSASGLDTSMTYTVSGSGDVTVIAKQPAGLGIIHLTLQVSASAAAGARTLFIQNTNLDKAAASGALEVY